MVQTLALLLLAAAWACSPSPEIDQRAFVADLEQFRTVKNDAMRAADSPIPPARQQQLLPLAYFPPSIDYRVPASLTASTDHSTIQMPTSTGQLRQMVRVGRLGFTLKGQQLGLTAFVEAGSPTLDRLFVPFTDMTSGTETYPAGRYLRSRSHANRPLYRRLQPARTIRTATTTRHTTARILRANRLPLPVHAGERMKK